ncbi:MAG TPA: fluoride efflux transporter CrcB [Solirubrobacteraceae bacterium]|nr:fluoride efflux transporter CrcB [Solirubrobacteraceae bacterium]
MSAPAWIAVAALGSLGSLARFLFDGFVSERSTAAFPFGTLAVNASGALVLGLLSGIALSGTALTLAGSATIGSYTTFSTWMFETHRLGEDGRVLAGVANVLVSASVGIGAALLGRTIGAAL